MIGEQPLTSSPRLRKAVIRRICNFGNGRMEIHSAVLEALVRDADDVERLRKVEQAAIQLQDNVRTGSYESTGMAEDALFALLRPEDQK